MVVTRRMSWLLASTVLGTSLIALPAFAQDAQNQQKMQNEINSLQQQLQTLQDQVAQNRVPAGLYNQASPLVTKGGPAWLPTGIQISLAGSFLALEAAARQHNEVSDGASDPPMGAVGIPLQNSVLYHENEFRMSAQQSRIALKATGDIDPYQHLKGYYEMDFLGASTDANNRQSNSFTPRIRQLYGEYDNDNYHFHTAFGQTWSLVTQSRVGMMPGAENSPLTIDAQYLAGFDWTRQPTIRLVQDWNKVVWFGLSIEQPQGIVAGSGAAGVSASPPVFASGTAAAPGFVANANNTCTGASHLDNTTTCTNDIAPDLVEKIAFDPGWGHYEVLGMQRWFADDVSAGPVSAAGVPTVGTVNWRQKVTFGWGVGGNVLLPVVPKYLDLQGSVLTGQGIGRYGDSNLPDVVVGPTGALTAIQATHFLVGAVGHPFAGNDIYVYYGQEQNSSAAWTRGANQGGWGNSAYVNSNCAIESGTGSSFNPTQQSATAAGGLTAVGCAANIQRTQEFTVGFWQDAYKGDLGRVRVGLQYEYQRITAFAGSTTLVAGTPAALQQPNAGLSPNNNVVFISLRYYPFN
jgi:hypothetical protein